MAFSGNQRFQLRRELGRGGMGVVWEAYDTERKQPVALKMLHQSDAETIFQIKREFRSLSEVAHPRLVSMYELLCHDEDWFFTMEFIRDGKNFMKHIHAGDPLVAAQIPKEETESTETFAGLGTLIPESMAVDLDRSVDTSDTGVTSRSVEARTLVYSGRLPGSGASGSQGQKIFVVKNVPPERLAAIIAGFGQLAEGVRPSPPGQAPPRSEARQRAGSRRWQRRYPGFWSRHRAAPAKRAETGG